IAEKGTSTSPPHILRCIANAETAKPDCTETGLDLALFSEIKSVMFVPYSNAVYVTAVDAATGTSALYYVMLDANTGLPSSSSLSMVQFSDGLQHSLDWVFSAPAETDSFYAASSSSTNMYYVKVRDISNPGMVVIIRDIELTGLSADALTVQPQIFTRPSVWQDPTALREERAAPILKNEDNYRLWTSYDYVAMVGQGNTVSMCGGTLTSSTWRCVPATTFGAAITAISAPTSFSWEWNVGSAQIWPTADFVFGFGTPVPGHDTTLLGCSMFLPIDEEADTVVHCEPAAAESEAVTALFRL
nr:hypothetical protein [Gammaproteobacteria bacterium]